jgi:hypothetical protein
LRIHVGTAADRSMAGDKVWRRLAVKFKRSKARWHCTLAYRQDHCARAGCSTEIPQPK